MKINFYKCKLCNKIIESKQKGEFFCCKEPMQLLTANTTEAAFEKHIPVVKKENNKIEVCIGSVIHPMQPEHFIEFISIETEQGRQTKFLKPSDNPVASFYFSPDDKFVCAYAYCNLHGLWAKEAE